MEQMNLQITQTAQPTFTVEVVQNLVPVISAQVVIGGNSGGTANIEFGDTMTGTGTPADPVNVSNDILDQIQDNASQIAGIQTVIPATANAQNQLADQGFVNSSIQTATAYFRGDWATWADVPSDPALYPADATGNHTPITNDYMVVIADEQENGGTWRYKYTGTWAEQGKSGWLAEYQVNETPLTAAQLAALNSGVTAQAVASIANKQDKLTAGTGITIEGNTISASGGDFLPLSGGTLTGPLEFNATGGRYFPRVTQEGNGLGIYDGSLANSNNGFYFGLRGSRGLFHTYSIASQRPDIGSTASPWNAIHVAQLCNGEYLVVPTNGGTLARVEDIDAALGDISTALTAILGE